MTIPPRATAILSGAGSGIGRSIALALAKRGHRLVLLGRRLDPLRETLRFAAIDGIAESCDVRDARALAEAIGRARQRFGNAEIVVPAAGVARIGKVGELAPEAVRETIETNLLGAIQLVAAALPQLRAHPRSHLFLIASVAARRGFSGWSAYGASKAGLLGFAEALRAEIGGGSPRITSILPGATATPLWDELPGEWDRARMIPPESVARAVLFALDAENGENVREIVLDPAGGDL